MRYTDTVAIVTGAAGGVGVAITARPAFEGARLILVDRSTDNGEAVAFLGSDDATFVSGASLVADGGRPARL